MDETIKVTLYLPKALWKEFKLRAVENDRSYSDLVREALDAHLKNEKEVLK